MSFYNNTLTFLQRFLENQFIVQKNQEFSKYVHVFEAKVIFLFSLISSILSPASGSFEKAIEKSSQILLW